MDELLPTDYAYQEDDAHLRIGEPETSAVGVPDPNRAVFYTSGRASNEAAFVYQLEDIIRLEPHASTQA